MVLAYERAERTYGPQEYTCDEVGDWCKAVTTEHWSPFRTAVASRDPEVLTIVLRYARDDPEVDPKAWTIEALLDSARGCKSTENIVRAVFGGWSPKSHWLYARNSDRDFPFFLTEAIAFKSGVISMTNHDALEFGILQRM
jgi:hypothetical protein